MCFLGLAVGMASGRSAELGEAALAAVEDAVRLSIGLAGGFALWSGMLAIVEQAGGIRLLTRLLSPALRRLFPDVAGDDPAREAMAMNMAANLLGLGNAATPMGIKAMSLLPKGGEAGRATDTMCMFLVINASSLQLFPSTVVSLRAAAGSVWPASIVLPTLLSTAVSTTVGVAACALFARLGHGAASLDSPLGGRTGDE